MTGLTGGLPGLAAVSGEGACSGFPFLAASTAFRERASGVSPAACLF